MLQAFKLQKMGAFWRNTSRTFWQEGADSATLTKVLYLGPPTAKSIGLLDKRRYCTCLSYQAMRNRLLQGSSTHFMTAIIRNGPPVGFRCVFRSQRGELFGQIHNFGLIKDGFNLGAAWTWIAWMIRWKEGLQMWTCCRWFPQDGWSWFREARRDQECNGEFECPCAN